MRLIAFIFSFTVCITFDKTAAQPTQTWETRYNFINDSLINKQLYEEAHVLSIQSFQEAEKEFGRTHINYFRNAYQLGQILYFKKEYNKGITHLTETITKIQTTPYKDSLFYGRTLNLLGINYRRVNDLANAEKAYLEAYFTLLKLEKEYPKEYSACLNNLAVLYREIGKTEEAIEFGTKALAYAPKNSENYAARLNTLALLYKRKGQFKQALQMTQEALAQTDTAHAQYPLRLASLAYLYGEIGLFDKTMALSDQAAAIIERQKGKNAVEYATYANSTSLINVRLGNYKKALEYALHACKIVENNKEQTDYYYYLVQVAYCHLHLADLDKALLLALEAKTHLAIKPGKKSEQYIMALGTLVSTYQKKGNYEEALKLNEEQLELIKAAWSNKEEAYIIPLMRMIELYNCNNQPDKSAASLKELADNLNNQVLYNVDVLDEYSKDIFINNFIKNYEPLLFSQIKNATEPDKELITKAYEAELAIKGIILGSSQLFRQTAQKAQNTDGTSRNNREGGYFLKQWNTLKEDISKAYSRNATQKQIDSLNNQLSTIEEKMITLMPELQHVSRTTTRFEDVKKALAPDACAIEFVRFRYHNNHNWTDSILYGALVVRPHQPNPEFIYLCTEMDLKTLLDKSQNPQQLYATRGKNTKSRNNTVKIRSNKTDNSEDISALKFLSDLIWKPLQPHLNAVKTINYAPSGLLHQVAFAALPLNETDLISDQYQLNALSSTRELVKKTIPVKIENAVLYGGIQYGEIPKDSVNSNSAWQYLAGTKKEIDRISTLFKKKNIKCEVKEGISASEEDFKSENTEGGKSPQILHIATHGFFYQTSKDNKAMTSAFQTADNPLIRSGLVMANANRAWLGGKPQAAREDGILTAYEISNRNLSETHLVVLSACETGLGDIQGSEGVYGLQRAFKMAGVEYILMSLWQVPDKQTAELMERFYTHLLDGESIQMAFSKAQQSMKERYAPYYWAGFVLIR